MTITDFLSLEKPSKDDRIKIDVINDNTDKIDNHFKRNSIVLTAIGQNISVDATGPYYTVTNNTGDSVQVLLEGTRSIILDSGETQKAVKNTAETFTLTVSCASDVTVTYFQRNKDYIDNSLSDGRYLQISDFGSARNEESSSVCSKDMPLEYTAYGNDVEQYKVYGKTSQVANPSPGSPKDVHGVGDLVTDTESEHYGQYEIPIVCNGTTYNVYLDEPLYETNSVRDYIDYARQKVIRKTGVITYDGSTDENWTSIEYQTYGIDVGVQVVDTTDQNYIGHMYCDKLTSSSAVSNFVNKIAITNGKIAVHFDSSLTSVELFVEYLQSHPITVYFPLAEAVEEDVVLPDLPTIYGENQLYVDTDILPSIVSVSAALQYFSPREMYESFPSKDDFYTKSEVNTAISSLLSFSSVPTTLTSTGTAGEIAYDSNYMYTCIATNTWKKTAFDVCTYSTTETVVGTYMGKPLYRKVVDCGTLPNNTTKEILHGVSNLNIITHITGTAWDSGGLTIPLPAPGLTAPVIMYSDKAKIYITATSDRSSMKNSNVTIEYTKTTD